MATGADVVVSYGIEASYGVAAVCNKAFGVSTNLTDLSEENSIERLYGSGKRGAHAHDIGRYSISIGIDFTLARPDFLDLVLGEQKSEGVWTHLRKPKSCTIQVAKLLNNGQARISTYTGCSCNECTIDRTNERAAKVTMQIIAAHVSDSEGPMPELVEDSGPIYTYAECNFYMGDTKLAQIQNSHISITQNAEIAYGEGNRFGAAADFKEQEISVSCVNRYEDPALFRNRMMGSGTGPTQTGPENIPVIKLSFESLRGGKDLIFELHDCMINSYSSAANGVEVITEEMDIMPLGMTVTSKTGGE